MPEEFRKEQRRKTLIGGIAFAVFVVLYALVPLFFGQPEARWVGVSAVFILAVGALLVWLWRSFVPQFMERRAEKQMKGVLAEIVSKEMDALQHTLEHRFGGTWQRPDHGRLEARFDFQGSSAGIALRASMSGWNATVSLAPGSESTLAGLDAGGAPRLEALMAESGVRDRVVQQLGAHELSLADGRLQLDSASTSPDRNQIYRQLVALQRLTAGNAGLGPGEGERCPYCRDPLSDDPFVECFLCTAKHHRECWQEHEQRCAVFGCS